MRRSYKVSKFRKLQPDIKYNSLEISQFVNHILKEGKKSIALKIMYNSLTEASRQLKIPEKEVIEKALDNVRPRVEVKARRIGGATYQIPQPVSKERGVFLAIRWILESARKRKGAPMFKRLAAEFVDACRGEGSAIKLRDNVHRMAEANKAFAHYRY